MERPQLTKLYRFMLTARQIDLAEDRICSRGDAFFHLAGSGHEATVALAPHLTHRDWLHSHYRARALLLARGVPVRAFFDNLLGNAASSSQGRRMSAFFSDPRLNLLSMTTLVGNNALQSCGVAAAVKDRPGSPIVVCGVGDGTTQQGEFLEACGEAARETLPVLFIVEDNRLAISTRTGGKTFYGLGDKQLYGIPIQHIDGSGITSAVDSLGKIVSTMRRERQPALVVFQTERLTNHTNADNQRVYRPEDELDQLRDPIRLCEQELMAVGVEQEELRQIESDVIEQVQTAEREAMSIGEPQADPGSKRPLPVELTHPTREVRGSNEPELTMRDALRDVLAHHLQNDGRVHLYGQDIEDPKGDVFGVTRGLSSAFPQQVKNAPLSESTIVGVSIGRALAGELPVAMVQFADFLPLAYNQLCSELATMYWRTAGRWNAPVIVMAACGGYRPGLGPFHAQTGEAILGHNPGLDVFMPSTAADAAGMLNVAFASGRPTLFLYPKACLNDMGCATGRDVAQKVVPIGPARRVRAGRDITFVGWGNAVRLCEESADALENVGVEAEVIDLRSLSPWDERTVLASAEKTANLIVVHEDNQTCGYGAEILATVSEKARVPVATRRVTRPDTHVPCNFSNQLELLPSFQRVLTTAADMLDLDLSWVDPPAEEEGISIVEAIGSSPSDENVILVELHVKPGDTIQQGQVIASLEATKSVFELTSSMDGRVVEVCGKEGDTLQVGEPLLRVSNPEEKRSRPVTRERVGRPELKRRPKSPLVLPSRLEEVREYVVGVSSIASVEGSRVVRNDELLDRRSQYNPSDIVRRTGIEQRRWVDAGEDTVSMAVSACRQVLDQENLIPDDIDMLVCSTTSPVSVTPSTACQVLNGLTRHESMMQAYDINAACSGYLYALQAGYDYLQSRPHGRVLVVTTEVLSPLLDRDDFDTAILFGDAASATVLYGEAHVERALARLHRPELSAKGDPRGTLSVPLLHDGFIQMQGRRVFHEAVRSMIASLSRVCQSRNMAIEDLQMVVPHQANQRIIDAIQNRVKPQVCSNIRFHGNTSSTSIPLCLSEVVPQGRTGDQIGLCAFGGGFTFGAGILELT